MRRARFSIALLALSGPAAAAPLPPPYSYLQRNDLSSSIGSLFAEATPWLQDRALLVEAEAAIPRAEIIEQLTWTRQPGYILQVRVARDVASGQRMLVGRPRSIGPTSDPSGLLARDFLADNLGPGLSEAERSKGWQISPEDSFYIWATLEKTRSRAQTLMFGYIRPPLARLMERDALARAAQANFARNFATAERSRRVEGILQTLEQRHLAAEQRAQLRQNARELQSIAARGAQISADLAAAQENAVRASRLAQSIALLQNIVSLATLASQIHSSLPDAAGITENVASPKELTDRINAFALAEAAKVKGIQQLQIQVNMQMDSAQDAMRKQLSNVGVPPPVQLMLR